MSARFYDGNVLTLVRLCDILNGETDKEQVMIKAILFDFDGTVADTIDALKEGVNRTMRRHGYPEHTYEDILSFVNHGARDLIRRAIPTELQTDEVLIDRVFADYNRDYAQVYHLTDRAYDGVAESIARLHGQGYRIGVLSNKQDRFVKGLCASVLHEGTYDAAQGMEMGQPGKPHPYLAEKIARELGVSVQECIMIGDSDVDIATAKNVGMTHIGVSWGFRSEAFLREHGATHIARTPQELEDLIASLAHM